MWTAAQAQNATEEHKSAEGCWLMRLQVAAARTQAVERRPRVTERSDWEKRRRNTAAFYVSDYATWL